MGTINCGNGLNFYEGQKIYVGEELQIVSKVELTQLTLRPNTWYWRLWYFFKRIL